MNTRERPKTFSDIREAQEWGLYMVPQELTLATGLTVMENVFIGRREFSQKGLVNRKYIISENQAPLQGVFQPGNRSDGGSGQTGFSDAADRPGGTLLAGWSEGRCFRRGLRLGWRATKRRSFSGISRHWLKRALGIIFVTHMLDEIFRVCEHVVVFRAGEKVWRIRY